MLLSLARISNMVAFKRHTFIRTYIKLRGTHLPHISPPQIWSQPNSMRVSFFNVVQLNSQTVSPLTYNSPSVIKMTVHASYTAAHKLLSCCGYIPSACHTGTYMYLLRYIRYAAHFDDNSNDNGDMLMESDWQQTRSITVAAAWLQQCITILHRSESIRTFELNVCH